MLQSPPPPTRALPPGPLWPSKIQMLNWIYRPIPFMEDCRDRWGDWFTVRLHRDLAFHLTSDPKAVRDVFAGSPDELHAGKINFVLKPLLREHSILLLDGPDHIRERHVMMPPFHAERMHAYGELMRSLARETAGRWPEGRAFPVHKDMQALTLEVIMRAVFGVAQGETLDRLRGLLVRMLDLAANPIGLLLLNSRGEIPFSGLHAAFSAVSPWGKVLKLRAEVDKILVYEIRHRRNGADGDDILSLIAGAKDEQGQVLSEEALRDEMLTLLFAGHETTATALSWTLYHLGRTPGIQAKAAADTAYLEAAIKESLRLNPVVPFVGRQLQVPARIGGRELPAGAFVVPAIYLTHRRPDLWPEPERYRPERFLEGKPTNYEFFPFGGGVRRCLGMAFALYEMKAILGEVLSRWTVSIPGSYRARVVRRSITFAPSEGMPLIVKPR